MNILGRHCVMDDNFFKNIFNHLGEAVFVMDQSGAIIYVNDYLLQHSIFAKSEVLSSSSEKLFQSGKTDINIFQMVRRQKQSVTAIQTISNVAGRNQVCLVTQVPILDEHGEVAWSVGVIRIVDAFLHKLHFAQQSGNSAVKDY